MNSIAPDKLAALTRAALLAVKSEDQDPVCILDALWLAATMNAADPGSTNRPQALTRAGKFG